MTTDSPSAGPSTTLGRKALKAHIQYDFVQANQEYSENGTADAQQLTSGPRSRTAIITCVDSRSSPEHFYQLKENDAIVIRNGGGRTNDPGAIRSLAIIQATSELKEIKVVHHASRCFIY